MKKARKKTDHRLYRLKPLSLYGLTLCGCGLVFLYVYVLYVDPGISFALSLISSVPVFLFVRKELEKRYESRIRKEFISCLVMISGSLSAGLRLEQSIHELAVSKSKEYALLRPEFVRMSKLIALNQNASKAFEELAARTPVADIKVFSLALNTGLPAGINLVELIRNVSSAMRIKNDAEKETERTLNLPKYNNRIIFFIPLVLMFALRMMSPEYIAPLDSGTGAIVKTAALILIFGAFLLGEALGNVDYS